MRKSCILNATYMKYHMFGYRIHCGLQTRISEGSLVEILRECAFCLPVPSVLYRQWQLSAWQTSETTCHSAQRPSQDVEPFWGLISAWWAASMTAFNSLWATFIMHCLLWALDQMYPRTFTVQPTCPNPLYTVTYIHGSFIHEFVCLLLGLSVSDKRAAARPDCSV